MLSISDSATLDQRESSLSTEKEYTSPRNVIFKVNLRTTTKGTAHRSPSKAFIRGSSIMVCETGRENFAGITVNTTMVSGKIIKSTEVASGLPQC